MSATKGKSAGTKKREGAQGPVKNLSKEEMAEKKLQRSGPLRRVGVYLKMLGPGLITGASDDDPSGIGTYSQAGAQFGFGQLWTAFYTFPLMAGIQEICARIALRTATALPRRSLSTIPSQSCISASHCWS